MKITALFVLALPVIISAQDNPKTVYCDKTSLPANKVNSPEYADCIQPSIEYTKDEKLAYKIPGDCCTQKKLKLKKEAKQRLKDKGDYTENLDCCTEAEKLAYNVPDYDKWSVHELNKYKKAVNRVGK
jgi:hypothetical protein